MREQSSLKPSLRGLSRLTRVFLQKPHRVPKGKAIDTSLLSPRGGRENVHRETCSEHPVLARDLPREGTAFPEPRRVWERMAPSALSLCSLRSGGRYQETPVPSVLPVSPQWERKAEKRLVRVVDLGCEAPRRLRPKRGTRGHSSPPPRPHLTAASVGLLHTQ